jgi:DME family drug/metabolite transporter
MGKVDASGSGAMPRLQVLLTAAIFSTGGAVIKATSFTGWQVAGLRCGIAALAILILMPESRRGWTRKSWLVGIAYAGALICYALANKLTTAANTIFLCSTSPVYVLLLGPVLLKEPIRRRDLLLVLLFGLGLGLVFLDSGTVYATAPDPLKGNLLAVLSGLFFALIVIGFRWLGRDAAQTKGSASSAMVAGNLIGFAVCLPAALPLGTPSAWDWGLVVYLGVVQIGVAYLLFAAALRRIPALEASLLILLEPVLNPIWAWWLHGERPGPLAITGAGLILLATAALTLASAWRAKRMAAIYSATGQ